MKFLLGAVPNVPIVYHTRVFSTLLELCQDPGSSKAKKGLSSLFFSPCATVA